MDVQTVERSLGHLVAQPFQRRSQQRSAAVAVVNELQFAINMAAVRCDALPHRGDLAGNRSLLGLAVTGDARVQADS
jgi:hypothetical protein